MPGATNSTLLVEAQNQTVVALNELITTIKDIPTVDLSGIEAKLDSIASAINNIPEANIDTSSLEQKLEDVFGTPSTNATPSVRVSLNDIRDNLDVGDIGIPLPGMPDLGGAGIATIALEMAIQTFKIRDNLDIGVSDLFGSLGDLFELLGIDIPVLPVSAGLATIHGILTITLIAKLVEALGNDVVKQRVLKSIAARLSPDDSKNLYDKECCGGDGGGTGPGEDPTDNPLPGDAWRCKACNFILESLIDVLVAMGQIGFNYRKMIRQVGYNGYNGYDPTLYTTVNMYPVFSTADMVLPNEIRSKMTTQDRENFKTKLAELAAFEAADDIANTPFLCYFDNTYNSFQSGSGSFADYLNENKSDIVCAMFNAASVQSLGTELATIVNDGATYLTNGDWGSGGIVDMTSKIEVIKSAVALLLPQGLLNTAFTENDPLVPVVYAGSVDCAACGGGGGGGDCTLVINTAWGTPWGQITSGDLTSGTVTMASLIINFGGGVFGVPRHAISLIGQNGCCFRVLNSIAPPAANAQVYAENAAGTVVIGWTHSTLPAGEYRVIGWVTDATASFNIPISYQRSC